MDIITPNYQVKSELPTSIYRCKQNLETSFALRTFTDPDKFGLSFGSLMDWLLVDRNMSKPMYVRKSNRKISPQYADITKGYIPGLMVNQVYISLHGLAVGFLLAWVGKEP